jgi:hypothetical protein
MATGPQGQQGQQGDYGSRGVSGAVGWGYGTTIGPTGVLGPIRVIVPDTVTFQASITASLVASNAGTITRLNTSFYQTQSNTTAYYNYAYVPSFATLSTGMFWMISNDTVNPIVVTSTTAPSGTFADLPIKSYTTATVAFNGAYFVVV